MPRRCSSSAIHTAWCTSSAGYSVSSGRSSAQRCANPGSCAVASPMISQPSDIFRGRGTKWTGAFTRASSGWNRTSVVGRSATSAESPAASRARISVTMKVSEKRG